MATKVRAKRQSDKPASAEQPKRARVKARAYSPNIIRWRYPDEDAGPLDRRRIPALAFRARMLARVLDDVADEVLDPSTSEARCAQIVDTIEHALRGFSGMTHEESARTYFVERFDHQMHLVRLQAESNRRLAALSPSERAAHPTAPRTSYEPGPEVYARGLVASFGDVYPELAEKLAAKALQAKVITLFDPKAKGSKWDKLAEILKEMGLPWIEPESLKSLYRARQRSR